MADEDDELIADLWRDVRPSQLLLVHELAADVERLRPRVDVEAWVRVRGTCHRLAGTLGSFGQHVAGEIALNLDRTVAGVDVPDAARIARVEGLVEALHAALEHGHDPEDGTPT